MWELGDIVFHVPSPTLLGSALVARHRGGSGQNAHHQALISAVAEQGPGHLGVRGSTDGPHALCDAGAPMPGNGQGSLAQA